MAFAIIVEIPGGTPEQYDQVSEAMGLEGVEEAVPGMVVHFAGMLSDTLIVVDVWESREAYEHHLAERTRTDAVREAVRTLPPYTHREFEVHNLVK